MQLPALSLVAILNGQKDLGIAGSGGVVNPIALRVVKEMDNEVSKIHPSLIKYPHQSLKIPSTVELALS